MNVVRIRNNCLYVPNSAWSKTRTTTSGVRKDSANARRFAPVSQAARSIKFFWVGTFVTIIKSSAAFCFSIPRTRSCSWRNGRRRIPREFGGGQAPKGTHALRQPDQRDDVVTLRQALQLLGEDFGRRLIHCPARRTPGQQAGRLFAAGT